MGDRFARSGFLYGEIYQSALKNARVAICGVGAVGSFAAEGLARLGVSHIELFDFDKVEESNVNRQIVALTSTLGKRKADVMAERIRDINPSADVVAHSDFFIDENSVSQIAEGKFDVVVDAIDSISSKILLITKCVRAYIPIVSSMGAARRTDASKITTDIIGKTKNCPLASRVRKGLRYSLPLLWENAVKCVYSLEVPSAESHIASGSGGDCGVKSRVIGSSPIITGIFGLRLAGLAVDEIFRNHRAIIERAEASSGKNTAE